MTAENEGHEADSDVERLRLALRRGPAKQATPSIEDSPPLQQPSKPHESRHDLGADPPDRRLNPQALAVADMLLGAEPAERASLTLVRIGDQQMTVGPDGLVIGRRSAGLGIADGRISRRHAELLVIDGVLHVRDLGSSNGTFVHGERRTDQVGELPVALGRGDRITTIDDVLLAQVVDATRADS